MSLVGKAAPDMPLVLVNKDSTKTTLKKLMVPKKPMVISFVSKTSSPVETTVAAERMEEGKFEVKEKAVFVIVSLDGLKQANELHKEGGVRNCVHAYSANAGKEFNVNRTPCHVVIGADGKVKLHSEEEVVPYLALVR